MIRRDDWVGRWIDVVGDVLTRQNGRAIEAVQFVEPGFYHPIWTCLCPEPLMFHRMAVAPNGAIAVVGKGNETGSALLTIDGAPPIVLGLTNGNNPCAIYHDGAQFIIVWTEAVGVLARFFCMSGEHRQEPIPAPWTGTSQGILDLLSDGTPIYMDAGRTYEQAPWTFSKPNVRAGVRVGQWGISGHDEMNRIIVGLPGRTVFTGLFGTADDPRVSVLPSGRILVAACTPRGSSLAIIDPPYPPNEQPPVITIPEEPEEPEAPMSLPDPGAVLAALRVERAKFPNPTIGNADMGKILHAVARQFPFTGMHRKDGEKSAPHPVTGVGMSRDVLRVMPPGDPLGFWSDVLGATGAGLATPIAPDWRRSTDGRESFVEPVAGDDEPPIDEPPTGDLLVTRVDALEGQMRRILAALRSI